MTLVACRSCSRRFRVSALAPVGGDKRTCEPCKEARIVNQTQWQRPRLTLVKG